ncbi:MAG: hypothetical protein HY278_11800 [candidate division NC10 bacterium]|nr:hypothetical protein [candidate division NC10 bacterium]
MDIGLIGPSAGRRKGFVKTLPSLWLLLILAGPAFTIAGILPDYQQAEKKEFVWVCDADTTRIHTDLYRANNYYVSVSSTTTGGPFMSVYYVAEGRARFLAGLTGSPEFVDLTREEWQERIQAEMSPNYLKRIRNMENDCRCTIGCE